MGTAGIPSFGISSDPLGGVLGVSRRFPGAFLGHFGTLRGSVGGLLGRLVAILGISGRLGARFGPSWAASGAQLGLSWGHWKLSWAVLGRSGALSGPSWAVGGPSWGSLGPSRRDPGSCRGRGGPFLVRNDGSIKKAPKPSGNVQFLALGAVRGVPEGRLLSFFGPSWGSGRVGFGPLGRLWGRVGAIWEFWSRRRALQGPPGAARERSEALRAARGLSGRPGALPLLAPFERAPPGIVVQMTVGSSFDSHISLSNVKARCHCSPFSHALTPAL